MSAREESLRLLPLAAPEAQAQATPKPRFKPIGIHMPTHFAPGANNELFFVAPGIDGGHCRRAGR